MKKAWILSGIIGIGAVALPPGIARAADRDERDRYDYKDRDVRDDLDYYRRLDRTEYDKEGERLTFDNLPGRVKQTVGQERGRDDVTDVVRIRREGKTLYRVEIEGPARARAIWVDENGTLIKDLNTTEEGRIRVEFNDLPGPIKSSLIHEAHDQKPTRVWQVTRGHDTWYVAEAVDGHLIRCDDTGRIMSHDDPKYLSNRKIEDYELDRIRGRDREGYVIHRIKFGDLPGEVKRTLRDNQGSFDLQGIFEYELNGKRHYVVDMSNGHQLKIAGDGRLLERR
jgi:hypothetical protein